MKQELIKISDKIKKEYNASEIIEAVSLVLSIVQKERLQEDRVLQAWKQR